VHTFETSLASAREAGVTALFGEKYGEFVRVVDAGGFSRELCGGTHVANTAEIGLVKITSESSVGANLRRIEAITSYDALAYLNNAEAQLKSIAEAVKAKPLEAFERVSANLKTLKELQTAAKRAKQGASDDGVAKLLDGAAIGKGGYPVVIGNVGKADVGGLRNAWDVLRARMQAPGAVVIAADNGGKPLIIAAGTDEAVAAGFDALSVIKSIGSYIKGGGGGKPTMAQAGGKDLSGIEDALNAAKELLL
ncbi:MAG: DHHA1 domain-containing protein, partial [Eggerthellaceae bacterium]|nr:DHHA1 domain-containing protein [Eggerthellaceae bacterium]